MAGLLENPQVVAAIIGALGTLAGGVAGLLAVIRQWIKSSIDSRVAQINAEAMRDRAIADSIVHAASTNAQAMEVLRIVVTMLATNTDHSEEIERVVQLIEQSNHLLEQVIYLYQPRRKENHDEGNESSSHHRVTDADRVGESSGDKP